MTRYLLITDFQPGVAGTPIEDWKPEEVEAHLNYYRLLHRELIASGELVQSDVTTLARSGPERISDWTSSPLAMSSRWRMR